MNITELARRLNTPPEELREKLPGLGFSIGKRAIKVDDRVVGQIMAAWSELRRRERLQRKMDEQKAISERREQKLVPSERKPIELPAVITVRDFASRMQLPVARVMQELMQNGIFASLNERIDFDTAAIVAEDLGFQALPEKEKTGEEADASLHRIVEVMQAEKEEHLTPRAPVVVVMGHVDHGKTKLLDAIRKTHVMESEAGGITQHIGAYQVVRKDRELTFIDTPGHEAFTVMRSRGAKVADIAILVVAADDGVQPQTKEAINIIQSSHLPFVVALNKVDKPDANIERVKGGLAELKLIPEDWGGKTVMIPVSAKAGTGIDDLLDVLLLVADLQKDAIRANPARPAIGTIIESHVDPGEGPVSTVLIQTGTLRVGDDLGIRGSLYGRVRAMRDWNGADVKEAKPSTPVKILGLKSAPAVGDILEVPENVAELKKLKTRPVRAVEEVAAIKHAAPAEGEEAGKKHTVKVLIRSDVLGSLEAILGMLDTIQHEEVGVEVVGKGLGNITDTDILNAQTARAVVLGFNVRPTTTAEELARDKEVTIRTYSVIYKLFEEILTDLQRLLPSETFITELGKAEVLANFRKTDDGWIVGCKVKDGKLKPKSKIRILRSGEIIGEGDLVSVQIGRSEAKDAKAGQECGVSYKSRTKMEPGDQIEAYIEETKGRLLEIKGIRSR